MDAGDILAIRDLLARFGSLVAGADWDRLAEVLSPDAELDLRSLGKGTPSGIDEVRAAMAALDRPLAQRGGEATIQADGGGRARVHSRYRIVLRGGTVLEGEYRDVVVRGPDGWRLRRRAVVPGPPAGSPPRSPPRRAGLVRD